MSFFHNLNKTLDGIAARPEAAPLNERDMSRAAKGYEKYGKEGMEALAKAGREGKDLDKVRDKYNKYDNNKTVDEGFGDTMATAGAKLKGLKANITKNPADRQSAIDAHKGIMNKEVKKHRDEYGRDPMYPERTQRYAKAQQSAAMHKIDLDGGVEEGLGDVVKKVGGMAKKAGSAVLNKVGHGSDVDMIRDLQKKMNMPQTGMKPGAEPNPKQVKEKMSPAKQKSFAALAPPADKITFADKIAGAKKEVDEMLGDVAAEAMRNALGGRQQVADEGNAFTGALAKTPKGGKFKVGGKEFTDTSSVDEEEDLNPFTNYKKPRADTPRTGEVTHGAKHDTEWTATGRKVTRRVDPQGNSVGSETDAEGNTIDKRGRGRPKGPEKGPERTTAKAYKHKGERKVKEGDMEEESDELKAAMAVLKKAGYKVSKAVEEESTHTRDDRAEKAGKKVAKDIEYDEKKKDGIHGKKRGAEDDKAEKAGKKVAKDIEYDEKKDEVKEDEPKKSKSKFKFGGSVYEALDAQLET